MQNETERYQKCQQKCIDRKWPKLAQSTPKSKLLNMHFCFMLYQNYLKDETGTK